ncbi:MAG: putative quinol monooxygenase [Alphaproteobacteria bacterium]|jgi:quinol monooxygenase YgiN|nr:putative quinol monooxygenase [Alphaproteobacteria bacterium]MDP6565864.1 putative quinol monooxygenase [Alphaproteobacteria bacterium]MDP6814087.1 putative quinol monooxygenase [Alphaproteobacteria bacterium]
MISIVATIRVKEGCEADFESVAKELVAAVNANEPGCLFYQLHKGEEPLTYYFIERYENEAAIDTHRQTDHFKQIGGRMGPSMAGRPDVLILNQIS